MKQTPRSYFEAASRLRDYARINREDTEFVADGGEIVYVFDTSILVSYWLGQPESISGTFGTDKLMTRAAASQSGLLTLQYLMEGLLPGMRRNAFMSSCHWNEALVAAKENAKNMRHRTALANQDLSAFEQLLPLLERFRLRPSELISAATDAKLGDALTAISNAVSYDQRLRTTFERARPNDEPSVRDLAHCDFWDAAKDAVSHADFSMAHREITAVRPATGQRADQIMNANRNDALTFAALRAMIRENVEAGGDRPSVRFVFVTPDKTLHEAFGRLQLELDKDGVRNFIRHPHVYSPILNYSSMTNGQDLSDEVRVELRSVFEHVELALRALLPFAIVPNEVEERSSVLQLRKNIKQWSLVVDRLQLVNSSFILSEIADKPERIDRIAEILSSRDVREAVAGMLEATISKIREDHLQGVSVLALDRLASTAERQLGSSTLRIFRAPVKLLDVDVLAAIGMESVRPYSPTTWLDLLLRRIRSGEEPNLLNDVVLKIRHAWTDPTRRAPAQLLASCIYFAVGAWDSARLCAQFCRERLSGPEFRSVWMREARYCEALATRMQLVSSADVRVALNGLAENLADFSNQLAQARDRVERATLMLDATVSQSIDDHFAPELPSNERMPELVEGQSVRDFFDKAVHDLAGVLEIIDNFDLATFASPAVRIQLQAQINLVGAYIFRSILGTKISTDRFDRSSLLQAIKALEASVAEYDIELPRTGNVYILVGKALMGDEVAAAKARILLTEPEAGQERSRTDLLERSFFLNALSQMAA